MIGRLSPLFARNVLLGALQDLGGSRSAYTGDSIYGTFNGRPGSTFSFGGSALSYLSVGSSSYSGSFSQAGNYTLSITETNPSYEFSPRTSYIYFNITVNEIRLQGVYANISGFYMYGGQSYSGPIYGQTPGSTLSFLDSGNRYNGSISGNTLYIYVRPGYPQGDAEWAIVETLSTAVNSPNYSYDSRYYMP